MRSVNIDKINSNSTAGTQDDDISISQPGPETCTIFIPIKIKKRGGAAMVIMEKNEGMGNKSENRHFDNVMIKSVAKAYRWKHLIDTDQIFSLADIAREEKLTTAYVSKVFNLNFLSPKIIEKIVSGALPRTLKLQDLTTKQIPELWWEQEGAWGF